ncbi:DUF3099 domain-containing protein [Corynebacterium cystitidis]|uniref:DUF3099 domain-containing protein n=1 Tax=Corynebacterium cystitidis DSM 20524 TaxID=1121357 RepID=A0A1H9PA61_9CORY|nr:DUF3099 domain-containing protein [Corynebacterium cystitidis]WJY82579.1 hypothetical protein CCYS_08315 [Corynebacterium cystitidis DSM 20524]SER44709.1 Protein of unknown function [Corynebacterium cystitidis DSM 20524]SNV73193.1 hypothetical membrane protein [Corynebacterium cystitidis]
MEHSSNQDWVDVEPESPSATRSRKRRFRLRSPNSFLITDAKRSPEQNRHSRERSYLILQLSRVPFILVSILFAFLGNWWLATVFFIVSVPLPWISVVIANGRGEPRDSREKNVYKPAAARYAQMEAERHAQLGPAHEAGTSPGNLPATIDHEDSNEWS